MKTSLASATLSALLLCGGVDISHGASPQGSNTAFVCLGYSINQRIDVGDSNLVDVVAKMEKGHIGLYAMKCLDDFGGVKFENCRVGVDGLGVKVLTAHNKSCDFNEYRNAVKQMKIKIGEPVSDSQQYVSWVFKDGARLNFVFGLEPYSRGVSLMFARKEVLPAP